MISLLTYCSFGYQQVPYQFSSFQVRAIQQGGLDSHIREAHHQIKHSKQHSLLPPPSPPTDTQANPKP